jgi:putative transposase
MAMPNYRRLYQPGGRYFFTVNLADRSSDALVRNIDALRRAWSYANARYPFETLAAAVMPDHLHCIWRLPTGDQDFSVRWRLLKGHFSRSLAQAGNAPPGRRARERGVWQRRFWEHLVRDEDDLARCADYIHGNPVKHGYCARVDEWPYSSWRKWNLGPNP